MVGLDALAVRAAVKKITHPDLAVQERLQSLRREKWVLSIIYGILWPMALAISVIYAR